MQYQNTVFDYTAKVTVRNSLCVLAPHPILVYIDQSYSLLVIDLQCQVPQNLLVLILMASEAVVESSENVSDVWRRVTLHGAEVSSLRQSSQGRSGGIISNKWRLSF